MKKTLVALMLVSLLGISVQAADVNMTANNAGNNSSFNMNVNWNPAGVPAAGNDYHTGGYLMRSPADGTKYLPGDFTFAGDSLTIGYSSTGTLGNPFNTNGVPNNNGLLFKLSGQKLTVDNLILDAGSVRDGLGSADNWHLAGNITVTANGGGFQPQSTGYVDSKIMGTGPIYIGDSGNTDATRVIIFTSSASTYTGNIIMTPGTSGNQARSRLTLADDSLMNFVIGLSGVNNSISGTGTLKANGDFKFDLTGASTTLGDMWKIASVTSQTFGDTFTVVGFTDIGWNRWMKPIDDTLNYKFNESTGILMVVPEPATMTILGLGALALLRKKR